MKEEIKKFSLKDELFNEKKVQYFSRLFSDVNKDFDGKNFTKEVLEKFPVLELKERISHMTDILKKYLDKITNETYEQNLKIIVKALPSELDPEKTDDDFGDFILAPFGHFVSEYGCQKKYLKKSFAAMEKINKRFSTEFEIRDFFNKFEKETFSQMLQWSMNKNYHVRRIASEGSRPSLPWTSKIDLDYKRTIEILDNLYFDTTRYVTRSVANHLNDISKIDPDLVIQTLKRWKKSDKQEKKEMDFIINHSLRTLIRQGNSDALELLGFSASPKIKFKNLKIKDKILEISKMKNAMGKYDIVKKEGQNLEFSFKIISESKKKQKILIDYKIYFQNKNGKITPKVFKLKKIELEVGKKINISKKHPLRIMSTKKIYPGEHFLGIQINGKDFKKEKFTIK